RFGESCLARVKGASAADLLKAEDADAEPSHRPRSARALRRIGHAVQRRLELRAAHPIWVLDGYVFAIEDEGDIAAFVGGVLQLRFQMFVDRIADVFLQRVGGLAVEGTEPLQ